MTTPVTILGSTGSVGISTLDVVAHHPERFTVRGLSAFSNVEAMLGQVRRFHPESVVMVDGSSALELERKLREEGLETTVGCGEEDLVEGFHVQVFIIAVTYEMHVLGTRVDVVLRRGDIGNVDFGILQTGLD